MNFHEYIGATVEVIDEQQEKAVDAVFIGYTRNAKYVIAALKAPRSTYGWKVKLFPADEQLALFKDKPFHRNTGKLVRVTDPKTGEPATGVFLDSAKSGSILVLAMPQLWAAPEFHSMWQVRSIQVKNVIVIEKERAIDEI